MGRNQIQMKTYLSRPDEGLFHNLNQTNKTVVDLKTAAKNSASE